ncbi:MAG: glycosyltransferase family 2 protein, partial [Acidimicrobiales bacterium]
MTSISAVVVTWNSAEVLPGCLATLEGADEVVVVDNGSKDSTREVAASFSGVRVIANPDNRGLAAANNQGLVATCGDAVLICNPDVIFHPGAVAELAAALERHARAGWVEPHLLYEDGETHTSAGDLPSLGEALLGSQLGR